MEHGVIFGLLLFFLGILIGLPLAWVFLGSSIATIFIVGGSLSFFAGTFYHAIDNYVLMAIAFFIYAGNLLAESGIAVRLVRLSYSLVGRVRGGLVDVGIVAATFMGALTGSSLPVIAALIPILVPGLEKLGYQRKYVTAVLCSSSFLGYLIPPSVPGLLYCLVAQQSVGAVFLSTVIPGLILAAGYITVNTFICHRYYTPAKDAPKFPTTFTGSVKEIGVSTWVALPALGCPFVVLVGIYGGIFTPNEAGAIAVLYTALVGFFVYRELTVKSFWESSKMTVVAMGMLCFLLGFGTVFTRLLIREGVGELMTQFILSISDSKYAILFMMNVLLLILGMFIDGIPIIIIVVPMILPLIQKLDVNLVHLGSIIVFNIGLGVVTPPYAISIFLGTKLSNLPYEDLVPTMMIYLLAVGIPALMLTTYIPWLSLWLPTLIMGKAAIGIP
ncbi:MAG: TRAP transporter large permease [Deltaproteobacteria bacterium]|nr:TRAP transporter large permease [Deltaproteobacteria bacterium]